MSILNRFFGTKTATVDTTITTTVTTQIVTQLVPTTPIVCQGKWGYYPASPETFKKLKELHKWYHETLRNLGTWVRWTRKKVHKVGPEPKYCHTFVVDKWEMRKYINKEGFTGYRWYPKTRFDCGVCEAYQTARMPKKTAEEVVQLKISEAEINRLHTEVSAFFKK